MDSNWSVIGSDTDGLTPIGVSDVADTGVAEGTGLPKEDTSLDLPDLNPSTHVGSNSYDFDDDENQVEHVKNVATALGSDVPARRPQLTRVTTAPPPPQQPPPPPAFQNVGLPQDSLSLAQLKKTLQDVANQDLIEYDFKYSDTASFEEELDEWFYYTEAQARTLSRARSTFERRWKKHSNGDFFSANISTRVEFVQHYAAHLTSSSSKKRCQSLQTLMYIALGIWYETAGIMNDDDDVRSSARAACTQSQLAAIKYGCRLIALCQCDAVSHIYQIWKTASERMFSNDGPVMSPEDIATMHDEFNDAATILYVVIECARLDNNGIEPCQDVLAALSPQPIDYIITLLSKLRWGDDPSDETQVLHGTQNRVFLLFWKSLLLSFGGTTYQNEAKESLRECPHSSDMIVASPIEYHMFRQELMSKYPAYIPPSPMIPLGASDNSILPPMPNHRRRDDPVAGTLAAVTNNGGTSILHQPVHIATPAPSPPPSPAIGGKAGKKQNYQTDQKFPFMYPPLDSTSNSAGGKGTAGLQDSLVGRKFHGSDVPVSIIEAGELFASRTKMTRSLRQLWEAREKFLKFERGWDDKISDTIPELDDLDADVDELELEKIMERRLMLLDGLENKREEVKQPLLDVDFGPNVIDDDLKDRLTRIEKFYRTSLPNLQSVVIVLLKAVLANVTALVTQSAYPPSSQEPADRNNGTNYRRGNNPLPAQPTMQFDVKSLPRAELQELRNSEISSKAVSGILLILLKWFKISHILKFEYLTQLLLDANYMPLILKLFAHSDIDKMVETNTERIDYTFFYFCNFDSRQSVSDGASVSSADDAVPPPIKRHPHESVTLPALPAISREEEEQLRPSAYSSDENSHSIFTEPQSVQTPDSFDQVPGCYSPQLKTDYSWRHLQSSINYLRVLQKICKSKAHRNLLLVQFKSSAILKKALKIPEPHLRLYTLKLFKGQVTYCGRKWRQQNMKVITQIYEYVKPELSDNWLSGTDVDNKIEESLPLEQAIRGLSHWYNVQNYPSAMGFDEAKLKSDRDFFTRELEKIVLAGQGGEEVEGSEINEFEG